MARLGDSVTFSARVVMDRVETDAPPTDWKAVCTAQALALSEEMIGYIKQRDEAVLARQCAQDDGKRWRKVNAELRDELTEARETVKWLGQRIANQRRAIRQKHGEVETVLHLNDRQRKIIEGLREQLDTVNGLYHQACENKTTLSEVELMDQIRSMKAEREELSALAKRQSHRIDALKQELEEASRKLVERDHPLIEHAEPQIVIPIHMDDKWVQDVVLRLSHYTKPYGSDGAK